MAIDYQTDIVDALFASEVGNDANYEVPGNFGLPTGFGGNDAQKRILTFIEILRSYFSQIDNTHEAKLLQDVMGRMMAAMHIGGTAWDTTAVPVKAQKDALRFVAGHVLASDL